MNNLSVYDMMVCLEHCHGIDEDLIMPATFTADGDPKKFEKVLAHFTGDQFQKFTDPTMRHEEECQIPHLLMPEKFTLEIELGNSAMMNNEHLIDALTQLADRLGCMAYEKTTGKIQDRNGRSVGSWELK